MPSGQEGGLHSGRWVSTQGALICRGHRTVAGRNRQAGSAIGAVQAVERLEATPTAKRLVRSIPGRRAVCIAVVSVQPHLPMSFINELLVGTTFPARRTAAMRTITLHTPASSTPAASYYSPMPPTVNTLEGIGLNGRAVWSIDPQVAVRFHSSHAIVTLIFGVPPETILRVPMPFAVPSGALISRPGLAIHV